VEPQQTWRNEEVKINKLEKRAKGFEENIKWNEVGLVKTRKARNTRPTVHYLHP
jgi:uncharacterized pyridoxal phosphate-containing UPF0001 family protein